MFRTPDRLFRVLSIAEAITWTILIAAIIARAVGAPGVVVTVGGGIHGFVFLAYAASAVLVAVNQRWRLGVGVLAVASAVVPYATIPAEIWLRRTERLDGSWRLEAAADLRDRRWYDRTMRWLLRHPLVFAVLLAVGIIALYVILLLVGPPGGR